ncbi:MAG: Uncharacterized protein FD162_3609 [Rhodobacteraceae bacterium]|uniref:hypothetical protein n=1 Tax=Cypionkella sp. TaxID=2811411 RepID=UPI0013245A71|nr:hypothetical protein [Cypionkella sp.]KAF0170232.1 MAG: Uncharacterized protein FD162_3609 [Paracoccaceae bacterium]MDO8327654.1 hypothetical protein [Cypionkella sp.]
MTDKPNVNQLVTEVVEAAVTAPTIGLKVLLAEMQALSHVIPGGQETPEQRAQHEAAVEADFDNMPV